LFLPSAFWHLVLPHRTPARADFSVMKFEAGYCGIWWNNSANPLGTGWSRVATAPDFMGAWAAQDAAVKKGKCK
jgi:hypothetical protein